ncbi:MAG: drug/metabolite transporter (DMT)-like permease [Phenylobacterium sp.]|jgi:drug/metabolite transporter (DMT)-like permease
MAAKTLLYTVLALLAFAANSVLCRLAMGEEGSIDAAGFTIIRLLSGIVVLMLILAFGGRQKGVAFAQSGSWSAAFMLFVYAICFSFAYVSLDTATGAVILFGSVQLSIILLSLLSGNRLLLAEWVGVLLAFAGFVYLMLPGVTMPSVSGFMLMVTAGCAWGVYTLKGKGSKNPLMDTGNNFLRTSPLLVVLAVVSWQNLQFSAEGVLWAVLSGAIASGIGYTIWYMALGGLATTQAAVVQLSVPVIAAVGGIVFVAEPITLRLVIAAAMILSGIFVVVLGRRKAS